MATTQLSDSFSNRNNTTSGNNDLSDRIAQLGQTNTLANVGLNEETDALTDRANAAAGTIDQTPVTSIQLDTNVSDISATERAEYEQSTQDKTFAMFQSGLLNDYDPRAVQLASALAENKHESEAFQFSLIENWVEENNLDPEDGQIYRQLMDQTNAILGLYNDDELNQDLANVKGKVETKYATPESPIAIEGDEGPLDTDAFMEKSLEALHDFNMAPSAEELARQEALDELNDTDPLAIKSLGEMLDEQSSTNVIVMRAHGYNTLGELVAISAGLVADEKGVNKDTSNDDFFAQIYEKMSEEDKKRSADAMTMINVETGEVMGTVNMSIIQNGHVPGDGDGPGGGGGGGNDGPPTGNKPGLNDNGDNGLDGQNFVDGNGEQFTIVDAVYQSPIILDLDGDGIQTTNSANGTSFDLNGDGNKQVISWTEKQDSFDDAFLVMDKNGDGQINSGKELFGDANGAANGYEELAKLDSNQDGKIDATDAAYKELKLWADMNKDGKVNEGEMKTLEEMGVSEISTQSTGEKGTVFDENGNDVSLKSTFVKDGKTMESTDVYFKEHVAVYSIMKKATDYQTMLDLIGTVKGKDDEKASAAQREEKQAIYEAKIQQIEDEKEAKEFAASEAAAKEREGWRDKEIQQKSLNRSDAETLQSEIAFLEGELSSEQAASKDKEASATAGSKENKAVTVTEEVSEEISTPQVSTPATSGEEGELSTSNTTATAATTTIKTNTVNKGGSAQGGGPTSSVGVSAQERAIQNELITKRAELDSLDV